MSLRDAPSNPLPPRISQANPCHSADRNPHEPRGRCLHFPLLLRAGSYYIIRCHDGKGRRQAESGFWWNRFLHNICLHYPCLLLWLLSSPSSWHERQLCPLDKIRWQLPCRHHAGREHTCNLYYLYFSSKGYAINFSQMILLWT